MSTTEGARSACFIMGRRCLETLKGLKKRENVHVPRQCLKLDCCDSPFESPKKKIQDFCFLELECHNGTIC